MGAQRPILAFGPTDGDAAEVMRNAAAGSLFDYADSQNAADFILKNFLGWKSQEENSKLRESAIEQYTRRNLTGKLAKVFEGVVKIK